MTAPAASPGEARSAGAGGDDWWGAEAVCVKYGGRLALDDVSFRAVPGRVSAVVGGDGAGRTTLLRCLAGALAPSSGRVRLPAPLRIGYLSAGSGTYPDLSVADNLAFRAAAYQVPAAAAREHGDELLERAGLAGARGRLAGQLSGGMRQKLGVIAAMLHQPDLLVLDEPTTGIDPVSRADLWWLIARAAASGAAVVLATSYLDEAERAFDVLALDAGRVLARGTPQEIVAAMPGTLRAVQDWPQGETRRRAWRRAARWRVWDPDGEPADAAGERLAPDLQDAITVAILARELAGGGDLAGAGTAGRGERAHGDQARGERQGGAMTGMLAQCTGVTRRFGHFVAVDGVDLELGRGEVVGLLGANGAGKTTLIRMLLGLLATSGGEVLLFGEAPSRRTRQRIGYVPQTLGLYDDLTPAENLAFSEAVFGAAPAGGGQQAGRRRAAAAGLPEPLRPFGRTVVGSLPLGVQRSAAFAQALAHHPELLILDEPTSGVDPLARARLWETVAEAAASGVGVLVTTHYMDEAEECDRLMVMADGRVVAEGTSAQITGDARVSVVESGSWAAAFGALEAAGLPVALVGRTLRVPGAAPADVRRALGGVQASVSEGPATLEERFFELTLTSSRAKAPA